MMIKTFKSIATSVLQFVPINANAKGFDVSQHFIWCIQLSHVNCIVMIKSDTVEFIAAAIEFITLIEFITQIEVITVIGFMRLVEFIELSRSLHFS